MSITQRIFRILKWFVIGCILLVAMGAMVIGVLNYRAGSRLEQRLVAISESGFPRSLSELAMQVPEDQNAYFVIEPETEAINQFVFVTHAISYKLERSSEENATLAKACSEHAQLLTKIRSATHLPYWDTGIDNANTANALQNAPIKSVGLVQSVERMLYAEAVNHLNGNRPNLALANANALIRWGTLTSEQPLLLGFLVAQSERRHGCRLAGRAIVQGADDPDQISELTRLLDEIESNRVSDWEHVIASERVFGLALSRLQFPRLWYFTDMQVEVLDLMQAALESGDLSLAEFKTMVSHYDGTFAFLLVPALQTTLESRRKTIAHARALRCFVAWSDQGKTATSISELELSAAQTTDPFTGDPLRWKSTPNGPLIYSVGQDGVDDGGKVDGDVNDALDIGVAP